MIAILEYAAGNQTSVRRALDHLGIPCEITNDPERLKAADGIIFPGVGAAGRAMDDLRETGLDDVLRAHVAAGRPLLGICVGCQIMLDYSVENDTEALGMIHGQCVLFTPGEDGFSENGEPIRVPHMGFNKVALVKDCALFEGVEDDAEFYFVHSFYPEPGEEFVIGKTTYGRAFCSVHGREGLWAVQFHPEKSGRPGLRLLQNFAAYCKEAADAQ